MPELLEHQIGASILTEFHQNEPAEEQVIQKIWADATVKEALNHPAGSPASRGHVYEVLSSSTIARGNTTGGQPLIYPPQYASPEDIPISSHQLRLSGVFPSPRNIMLLFKDKENNECWTQIQLLQHTTVQIFENSDWEKSICQVPKEVSCIIQHYPRSSSHSLRSTGPPLGHNYHTKCRMYIMSGQPSLKTLRLGFKEDEMSEKIGQEMQWMCFVLKGYLEVNMVKRHRYKKYTIAIDVEDRLEYSHTLHVWATEQAYISKRFDSLLKEFITLFVPSGRQGTWASTLLYRIQKTSVWSVIPIYGNSRPCQPHYPKYKGVYHRASKRNGGVVSVLRLLTKIE
ncbi:hypothetical protein H0H93_009340, partial [Arthromyces matolae]